jgi:hypothetical protein
MVLGAVAAVSGCFVQNPRAARVATTLKSERKATMRTEKATFGAG